MATCLFIDMERLGSQTMNPRDITYLQFLLKPVAQTQIRLKSDKNKILNTTI